MTSHFGTRLTRLPVAVLLALSLGPVIIAAENDAQKLMETVGTAVVTVKTGEGKTGSGFIVDPRTVVTNFHVISGADKAEIVLYDKTRLAVSGYSQVSPGYDIAVLHADIPAEKAAWAPKMARDLPKPGEKVFAFGAPLSLSGSITDGIVSAVRRGSEIEAAQQLGYHADSIWIQTSAPISPGNSGGPIVNSTGEVLGLATFTDRRGQNVNFAISASHIVTLLDASKFLGKQEKKLSELPRQKAREPSATGNATATLDFWNSWARLRTKAHGATRARPKARAAIISQQGKVSNAFLSYAEGVTSLKTKEVDAVLLEAVAQDAAIHRRLGEAWKRSVDATQNNRVAGMAGAAREIEVLNRQLAESDNALTELRFALSRAHGCEFPSFLQNSPAK